MSFDHAIEVNNLSKCYQIYDTPSARLKQMLMRGRRHYYKEFWALKDVSFHIKKGETVGIIGRNGSGKSTLLQMICGTLNPTAGTIKVQGRVAALLELGSGFNPEFTGRENVFFNAGVLGQSEAVTRQKFSAIEAFADIGDFIDQPVKTYSSGMMVRLAFAVIAHVDADVLVIDEALAVGDAFFTQKCMRFLREFMQYGTVLFVSHDTAAVKSLCTYAIWLDKGLVKQRGDPKDVCEQYLQAYYEAQQVAQEINTIEDRRAVQQALIDEVLTERIAKEKLALTDQRLRFLNASNLRNDLRLFEFNPNAPSFGQGGSRVITVALSDTDSQPLSWAVGGEDVELLIEAIALQAITSPIVGFVIKDRLGQTLFGDNTFVAYENDDRACRPGQLLRARFRFQMPRLPVGDYSVTIAIAEGTQEVHIQHQWIFDAITFRSESTSVSAGLIGIPMRNISLDVI